MLSNLTIYYIDKLSIYQKSFGTINMQIITQKTKYKICAGNSEGTLMKKVFKSSSHLSKKKIKCVKRNDLKTEQSFFFVSKHF